MRIGGYELSEAGVDNVYFGKEDCENSGEEFATAFALAQFGDPCVIQRL